MISIIHYFHRFSKIFLKIVGKCGKIKMVINMAVDGVFLHFLIKELKPNLIGKRIQKAFFMNDNDMVFLLSNKKALLVSCNPSHPHLRLTSLDCIPTTHHLATFLKRHIDGSIIKGINQHQNDRIVIIEVVRTDELGYHTQYRIILELTGRFANIIITNNDGIILEALKKSYLTDERIIQVKAPYVPLTSNKRNPWDEHTLSEALYEGVSPLLMREFGYRNSIQDVLEQTINPVSIKQNEKTFFYAFDLLHLTGVRTYHPTLSSLLEFVFHQEKTSDAHNYEQKRLQQFINKELTKLNHKRNKQINELVIAKENLSLENTANLLSANIHLVKPYQKEITVTDFITEKPITIALQTNISPNENINYYFQKFKKAKRTIQHLTKQIEETTQSIAYYENLNLQSNNQTASDLKEMLQEVGLKKPDKRPIKPNILILQDDNNNRYLIGKNNLQNAYITHTLASRLDYFFHVQHYPGSHVVLQGSINEASIKIAATLAAFYSQAQGKVAVDYTQIKWVKKIKGKSGSFVTYTNQKTVIVEGDKAFIDQHTNIVKTAY